MAIDDENGGDNEEVDDAEYDEALDEVLGTLRREYEDELPARFAELKNYLDKAKEGGEKQLEWLAQAHTIAHRLAGTAGSYGLAELSHNAGIFDAYCKRLLKSDVKGGAHLEDWREIDAMAEAIFSSHPAGQH